MVTNRPEPAATWESPHEASRTTAKIAAIRPTPEIARVDRASLALRPDLFVASRSRATRPAPSSPLDLGAMFVAIHDRPERSLGFVIFRAPRRAWAAARSPGG